MDRNPLRASSALLLSTGLAVVFAAGAVVRGADVTGYSVIKGQFLLQVGPAGLVPDPLFGYSVLAGVDLADFDLLTSARIRLPDGNTREPENLGDYWSYLDSFETRAELDATYDWGDYVVTFDAVNDGRFSCLVEMSETPLPPTPRLVNFDEIQWVDPTRPLTLRWEFDGVPATNDFVQIYVNLGHDEIYASPGWGEPGALTAADRTLTLPPDTLVPGYIHGLNLEITRIVSTNSECHPDAVGVGAVFRSTELDLPVVTPPLLRLLSVSPLGAVEIEVVADPDASVVLAVSGDFRVWTDVSTNSQASGTNRFSVAAAADARRFFRARVE